MDGKLGKLWTASYSESYETRTEQWGEQSNGGSSGLCSVLVGLAISQ